jgi:hypothetical protein
LGLVIGSGADAVQVRVTVPPTSYQMRQKIWFKKGFPTVDSIIHRVLKKIFWHIPNE